MMIKHYQHRSHYMLCCCTMMHVLFFQTFYIIRPFTTCLCTILHFPRFLPNNKGSLPQEEMFGVSPSKTPPLAIDAATVTIDPKDLINGFSADEIFKSAECQGITFDDLITLPGEIKFAVHEVDLTSKVSRNYTLNNPLASSPMDTVTEHEMAIAMALNGGIGFIHCNCSIEDQALMISKVKNYENGFILEPAVLSPLSTIKDLDALRETRKISGVPLTVDGKIGSKLVGLVSNTDTDFIEDRSKSLSEVMTPLDQLVYGTHPISINDANKILKESKKGYLPIIDKDGNLCALTTRTDLQKNKAFPFSSKDSQGKLLVGAAIKASCRDNIDYKRIDKVVEAGVNIIVLDASNGDNKNQIEILQYVKGKHSHVDVICGNVVRAAQAKRLLDCGADALRVGMGTGSVSTTQLVKAVGRPQLSSIFHCAKIAKGYGVPVIADGGAKNTGCIIKALSIGASVVMMGSLLAGVAESPGEYFFQDGVRLKHYRGSSSSYSVEHHIEPGSPVRYSPRQRSGSESGYGIVASQQPRLISGVSGAVVDKGPISRYIPYLCQSIRHGLQDMGVQSLFEMWNKLYNEELRFELRSTSAQKEGGVHDLHSFQQRLYA